MTNSRPHQGRIKSPHDVKSAGAPRQGENVLQRTTRCGLKDSNISHEYRPRTSKIPINTISRPCARPPSGHDASSRLRQTAEDGYRSPRRSLSVSSNGCIVEAEPASFAQEGSHGHVVDVDDLVSSDGDALSSLDSADLREFEECLLEGCPVVLGTSLLGEKGVVGESAF